MFGATKDEGCVYTIQFILNPELFDEVHDQFDQLGPVLLLGSDGEEVLQVETETARALLKKYTTSGEFHPSKWKLLSNLLGDLAFLAPIHTAAKMLQESVSAPLYYYSFR